MDDLPEAMCSSEGLGPMVMTRSMRYSLIVLRGYLIAMGVLLLYHVVALAGLLHSGH